MLLFNEDRGVLMFCFKHGDMGPQPEPPHTCPICDGRQKVVLEGFFAVYHANGRISYSTTHPMSDDDIRAQRAHGLHIRKIEPEEAE